MFKNVLIVGSNLSGKTTLARMINEKYNYNIISLDSIMKTFKKTFKNNDDLNKYEEYKNLFVLNYIKELSSDLDFYNGEKYVIEGYIKNIDKIIPNLDMDNICCIGLVYDETTEDKFYNDIKEHQSSTDWTSHISDEALKNRVEEMLKNNKKISDLLEQTESNVYDVSTNRDLILETACKDVDNFVQFGSKYKVKKMK